VDSIRVDSVRVNQFWVKQWKHPTITFIRWRMNMERSLRDPSIQWVMTHWDAARCAASLEVYFFVICT